MIPESAIGPLRQQVRTLQIVVAALAMGVLAFAGVAVYINLGKPQVFAGKLEPMNLMMLAVGGLMLVLGSVLPIFIFRKAAPHPALLAQLAAHPPEVQRVLLVQARLQMATILGTAMFEAGAFANLAAYFITPELLNLLAAGVLLLGILSRFPLLGPTIDRIERELQRMKEEEGLRGPR